MNELLDESEAYCHDTLERLSPAGIIKILADERNLALKSLKFYQKKLEFLNESISKLERE